MVLPLESGNKVNRMGRWATSPQSPTPRIGTFMSLCCVKSCPGTPSWSREAGSFLTSKHGLSQLLTHWSFKLAQFLFLRQLLIFLSFCPACHSFLLSTWTQAKRCAITLPPQSEHHPAPNLFVCYRIYPCSSSQGRSRKKPAALPEPYLSDLQPRDLVL